MVLHAKQETLTKTLSCLRKEDQDRKRNFESSDLLQGCSKEGKEVNREREWLSFMSEKQNQKDQENDKRSREIALQEKHLPK